MWRVALIMCLMTSLEGFGQTVRGAISGTVLDPDGATVANAPVQARNSKTGSLARALSTTAGRYLLSGLDAGTYAT